MFERLMTVDSFRHRPGSWGPTSVRRAWIARAGRSAAALLVAAIVAGCDSSAPTSNMVIVRVGSRVITKASFDHWLPVIATVDYELRPLAPVPDWVVPDPPTYARCIAHLKTTAPTTGGTAALKTQCQQKSQMLRQQVLGFLITGEWLISEGEAKHLHVTGRQVRQRFAMAKKTQFPRQGDFAKYLAATGETVSDQLFRSELKLPAEKMEQQILAETQGGWLHRHRVLAQVMREFPRRWAAKTSCQPGYVIADCREYRGPLEPEIVI
jgi:hypothetical protein